MLIHFIVSFLFFNLHEQIYNTTYIINLVARFNINMRFILDFKDKHNLKAIKLNYFFI